MPGKCCPYCGEVQPAGQPGRPRALSEHDALRLREGHELGESIRTLAKEFGIARNTVRKALRASPP